MTRGQVVSWSCDQKKKKLTTFLRGPGPQFRDWKQSHSLDFSSHDHSLWQTQPQNTYILYRTALLLQNHLSHLYCHIFVHTTTHTSFLQISFIQMLSNGDNGNDVWQGQNMLMLTCPHLTISLHPHTPHAPHHHASHLLHEPCCQAFVTTCAMSLCPLQLHALPYLPLTAACITSLCPSQLHAPCCYAQGSLCWLILCVTAARQKFTKSNSHVFWLRVMSHDCTKSHAVSESRAIQSHVCCHVRCVI